jgi:hypothetical protein
VKDKLEKGTVILGRLEEVVAHLKEQAPTLFLSSFDQTFENQKYEVLNYVFDPVVDGKWYVETTDGKFTLFRGSGRNESFHRRYVKKCCTAFKFYLQLNCYMLRIHVHILHAQGVSVQHTTSCPLYSIGTHVLDPLYTTPSFTF